MKTKDKPSVLNYITSGNALFPVDHPKQKELNDAVNLLVVALYTTNEEYTSWLAQVEVEDDESRLVQAEVEVVVDEYPAQPKDDINWQAKCARDIARRLLTVANCDGLGGCQLCQG